MKGSGLQWEGFALNWMTQKGWSVKGFGMKRRGVRTDVAGRAGMGNVY